MKAPLIIVILLLVLGVYVYIEHINNQIMSTITLDINPSIEINLNKDNKVISVIALNEDAKDIVESN